MDYRDETIQTYKKLQSGELKTYGPYFFQPQKRKYRIQVLVKHFIEEVKGWTPEEALKKMTMKDLEENHLKIILNYIERPIDFLEDDASYIIYEVYDELEKPSEEAMALSIYKEVLEGKRKNFPKNYFRDPILGERRALACFRYLTDTILGLSKEEAFDLFGTSKGLNVLAEYRLKIIMTLVYFSNMDLLLSAYPTDGNE